MKKTIAIAAILASSMANAEELKFGDVNYFFKQGQQNFTLDLNETTSQSQVKGGDQTETKAHLFSATYAYAFSDQLNAFIGVDYAFHNRTEDKNGDPLKNSFRNDGLSNPALGVNYRLLNQNSSRYNVDFGAVARIKLQDAERGTLGPDEKDGNFTSPGNSLEVNARMGRKWNEANEWQLAAGVINFFEGEYEEKSGSGNTDVDTDSYQAFYLRATYQYRPVNEFMTLLSLRAIRVGEQEVDAKGLGKVKSDAYTDLELDFTAKYLVTSNFIVKFNYGIGLYTPDYDVKVAGSKTEINRRHRDFFGLGVDYLF